MTAPAVSMSLAQEGCGALPPAPRQANSLRDRMPATAALVDELRAVLGRDEVDALLRETARGGRRFYAAELVGGELREWGRAPSGRVAAMRGGLVALVRPGDPRALEGARCE